MMEGEWWWSLQGEGGGERERGEKGGKVGVAGTMGPVMNS